MNPDFGLINVKQEHIKRYLISKDVKLEKEEVKEVHKKKKKIFRGDSDHEDQRILYPYDNRLIKYALYSSEMP